MKQLFLLLSILITLSSAVIDNFKTEQKKFSRVKTAFAEKEAVVKSMFKEKGIDVSSCRIFFRALKKEAKFEVWAKNPDDEKYLLVKTYDICSSSGELGPKRKQGDLQVPEGFYEINHFNPYSNFFLSLGVSYPNSSDKILGGKGDLGGAIYVHGDCVTIGCLPLTDDKIKEVYVMAVEAKSGGQKSIPIHIFPCKMDKAGIAYLEKEFEGTPKHIAFWKNIQPGYEYFETNQTLPAISVSGKGEYSFK